MIKVFMGNAMWQLVMQSDIVSKIVLLTLLGMSVLSWTIFLYKMILLRIKQRQMAKMMIEIKSVQTLDQLLAVAAAFSGTVPGYFLSENLSTLKGVLEANKARGAIGLNAQQWERIDQAVYQTLDDMVHHEESYLSVLSTSAAVSPLLGLFGTVWGLVHAFIRISEKQSADIATVAPGLAEAFITTLAGLMVAIPALIMFNYLMAQIRTFEQKLTKLADKFGLVTQTLCAD